MNNSIKIALLICVVLAGCYSTRVTEKSIKACMDTTGWSKERCTIELSR